MSRYDQLNGIIERVKPEIILEVGTWNGDRAMHMASEALKYREKVIYYGFDLFEAANDQTDSDELNVKAHATLDEVTIKLEAFRKAHPGFSYELIPGNTRNTLVSAQKGLKKLADAGKMIDLAFIDGGHSVDTIRSDYGCLKGISRVVVFDDYYTKDENGLCPDTTKFGCNEIVSGEQHLILEAKDRIRDGGCVQLVTIGLDAPSKFKVVAKNSIPDEEIRANVLYTLSKGLRYVMETERHDREAVMVSGGDSFKHFLPAIRRKQDAGGMVVCVKHAHDYLIDNGIIPWACVLLDPRPHVKDFVENPHPAVKYLTASQVHPSTLDRLLERKAQIWAYHAAVGAGEDKLLKAGFSIGGGTSSAARGIHLLEVMGFWRFSLFGYDSCFWSPPDMKEKDIKGNPKNFAIEVGGRPFWSDGQLVAQNQDFQRIFKEKPHLEFEVYGGGMIPWTYHLMRRPKVKFEHLYGDDG